MKYTKNNQKFLIITIFLGLTVLLNGCSLAKKEAGNETGDTLIGVFITDDFLNLEISNMVINESAEYINPLYAKVDRQNHRDAAYWEISFDGISGLNLLAPVWTDKNGAVCHATKASDGICDISSDLHATDNGNALTLSGTIYTLPQPAGENTAYYVNPVYQTADGKIYAVPGGVISSSDTSGDVMSTSFSSQTDSTEMGQTKAEKNSVTIRFASMFEPIRITLIQMDSENKPVKQEEYTPGKLPEELAAEKNTAYFLIETEEKTPSKDKVTSRSIYGREEDEESLETFYAMDNGIVSKQYTEIIWDN